MAALIVESARSAREESHRLRVDAHELRVAVRRSARVASARRERAAAAAGTARTRRVIPVASPWSGLAWLHEDEELNRVLVPLD
jgi:hypothetical protein